MLMRIRAGLVLPLLLPLCACKPPEASVAKAIVGTILIDGRGGPPLSDATVVMADGKILEAGPRASVELDPRASKIDGGGKYIVPVLIDLAGDKDIPRVSTQSQASAAVEAGAKVLIGAPPFDGDFVTRLRDLSVTVAPALSSGGAADAATVRALFTAGVPLAVASAGDPVRECELLVQAGVPPLDAIVAATRNGAVALHQQTSRGTVEAGKAANLLLLSANPGEDIRNLRKTVAF